MDDAYRKIQNLSDGLDLARWNARKLCSEKALQAKTIVDLHLENNHLVEQITNIRQELRKSCEEKNKVQRDVLPAKSTERYVILLREKEEFLKSEIESLNDELFATKVAAAKKEEEFEGKLEEASRRHRHTLQRCEALSKKCDNYKLQKKEMTLKVNDTRQDLESIRGHLHVLLEKLLPVRFLLPGILYVSAEYIVL